MHQSVHSFSLKIFVRSHTFQIQSIRKSISQRPHTIINQSFFTFQNPSFHRATDQSGILPQISQSKYVSIFAVPSALTYVSAIDNAPVYAFTNAPAYIPAYAFGNASAYTPVYASTYAPACAFATGYGPATNYASESTSASASTSARAPKSETIVFD